MDKYCTQCYKLCDTPYDVIHYCGCGRMWGIWRFGDVKLNNNLMESGIFGEKEES